MRKQTPNIKIRLPKALHEKMLADLRRRHPFAGERVGLLFTSSVLVDARNMLILCTDYVPVADQDYIEDDSVGARIGASAIRGAMQEIFDRKCGCFHVHLHGHKGRPSPSFTDKGSLPGVADSFANISGEQLNGYLILSEDSFYCSIRLKERVFYEPDLITVVGFPMKFWYRSQPPRTIESTFIRQSFLGEEAQHLFTNLTVGIVGYGGGGSHIGQQMAHIGFKNPVVFDADVIQDTNLNRLVGAWFKDIRRRLLKTAIAKRVFKSILPSVNFVAVNTRWQDNPQLLQQCDIVLGSVDSYSERQQLEAECRRYLIPLIDIGMDVHMAADSDPYMTGQVILSMPGGPCMWCYGFLTEKKLGIEAAKYGAVGGRPQVVWPNGVLASTAVGIMVELITGWTDRKDEHIYLAYDGNAGLVQPHIRRQFCGVHCGHYPFLHTGAPKFLQL